MGRYKHHECQNCGFKWDSDGYWDTCPECEKKGCVDQTVSDEREYDDWFYSEEEEDD